MAGGQSKRGMLRASGAAIAVALAGCSGARDRGDTGDGGDQEPTDTPTATGTPTATATGTPAPTATPTWDPPRLRWRTNRVENLYRVDVKVRFNDASEVVIARKDGGVVQRLTRAEHDGEWVTIASRFDGDRIEGGRTLVARVPDRSVFDRRRLAYHSPRPTLVADTPTGPSTTETPVAAPETSASTPTPIVVDQQTATPESVPDNRYLVGLEASPPLGQDDGERLTRTYTQYAGEVETEYTFDYPRFVYNYYDERSRPYADRFHTKYGAYISDNLDRTLMETIVGNFETYGEQNDQTDREVVEHLMSFVQHLEYTTDIAGEGFNEYPKFPVETLVEQDGDCEDVSILLASLLREFGYDTKLLLATADMTAEGVGGHCAVGIAGGAGVEGTYYEQDGTRYYYIEATAASQALGEAPS